LISKNINKKRAGPQGAISLISHPNKSPNVLFESSEIVNCSTNYSGGALKIIGSILIHIKNSHYIGNFAVRRAGAINL
jgi:hypothetical protein